MLDRKGPSLDGNAFVASEEVPMSKYTPQDILRKIEENGGPENLDLRREDLSRIDLGARCD